MVLPRLFRRIPGQYIQLDHDHFRNPFLSILLEASDLSYIANHVAGITGKNIAQRKRNAISEMFGTHFKIFVTRPLTLAVELSSFSDIRNRNIADWRSCGFPLITAESRGIEVAVGAGSRSKGRTCL